MEFVPQERFAKVGDHETSLNPSYCSTVSYSLRSERRVAPHEAPDLAAFLPRHG